MHTIIENKSEIIPLINSSREKIANLIHTFSDKQLTEPGKIGKWSGKDLIAHICEWENLMVKWMDEILDNNIPAVLSGTDTDMGTFDEFNEKIYQKHKDRTLDDILAEFETNLDFLISYLENKLEQLDHETLFSEDRFDFSEKYPLWNHIAASTFWHYDDHFEDLKQIKEEDNQ